MTEPDKPRKKYDTQSLIESFEVKAKRSKRLLFIAIAVVLLVVAYFIYSQTPSTPTPSVEQMYGKKAAKEEPASQPATLQPASAPAPAPVVEPAKPAPPPAPAEPEPEPKGKKKKLLKPKKKK